MLASAKISGPDQVRKHLPALTIPAVKERKMAAHQGTLAHAAPQGDCQDERWMPVVGWEDAYLVSSCGRIKNRRRNKLKATVVRSKGPGCTSYYTVQLKRHGKGHTRQVHRLIYEAFVGPLGDLTVNHKNGNGLDNRLENLEAVTKAENNSHRCAVLGHGFGERNGQSRLTEDQVRAIFARAGESAGALAREFGVNQTTVSAIRRGKLWRRCNLT